MPIPLTRFVGATELVKVISLVYERSHVAVVAPCGHGKTTLLREVSSTIQRSCVVRCARDAVTWHAVVSQIHNFARQSLDPPQRGYHKVYIIDDLDAFSACERGCIATVKELCKMYVGKLSIVIACDRCLASKIERVRPKIHRVDIYPVSYADMCGFGSSVSDDVAAVERAATQAGGSIPSFSVLGLSAAWLR